MCIKAKFAALMKYRKTIRISSANLNTIFFSMAPENKHPGHVLIRAPLVVPLKLARLKNVPSTSTSFPPPPKLPMLFRS